MPVAPKSMQDLEPSPSVPDAGLVREQLERLVAHSLFANSKRYPALLGYVVEQTLQGNAADLKERSIGIEVHEDEALDILSVFSCILPSIHPSIP